MQRTDGWQLQPDLRSTTDVRISFNLGSDVVKRNLVSV